MENSPYLEVIGHVLNDFGVYKDKYYFEGTPKNICNFILMHENNTVIITDKLDRLIINSLPGGFIDRCPDQQYLTNEIMPVMLPLQMGEVDLEEIEFIQSEEYGNNFVQNMGGMV